MNQIAFNLISAILGGLATYAFGDWNELLSLFLMAILVDYVTGIAASMKEQRGLNSQVGYWGLARKGLMLLVIMLAHRMDILMDTDLMMTGRDLFLLGE